MRISLCAALLLEATAGLYAQVKAYEEIIMMPTWEIGPPEVHSIFADGVTAAAEADIYPYTLKDILTDQRIDKPYHADVLENEYIKIVVLPEIGGRLHGALDKTNGYVWLYWQKTVKPGLISMTGAWISGGIEWNFPHGHRPSCFSKVDHRLVRNPDGSATVWVGETEPIYRMRWLVGMTLFPGRSYVRCDYVLINPTNYRHPFQFWATAATHANEWSQAQYPGDMVTGHGKHEFWNWPVHDGVDLTWWKNIPNASSFFAFNNPSDWFGTYDHKAQGGLVHVADHHVMPGKKLWTWGSGPSGRIWEDILTEGGGPYFEPQAGAWSDNQPDNHWIEPHEVKRAHDYWYPVRDTRGYHNATKDFAVNTDLRDGMAFGAVYSTAVVEGYRAILRNMKTNTVLSDVRVDISPDRPYMVEVKEVPDVTVYDLRLSLYDPKGNVAIEVQQHPPRKVELPAGMKDPGDPKKMNQDELYRSGEWLDKFQRRREALTYYNEALRRDPKDSRVNAEMGFIALQEGRWMDALRQFDTALERDADNSRLFFGKGLALAGSARYDEAYTQFFRAAYTYGEYAPAYLNLARLDMRRGDFQAAIEKAKAAGQQNGGFADIPALEAAAWRHLGLYKEALEAAERSLALDAMHFMGGYEKLRALETLRGKDAAREWARVWEPIVGASAQNVLELAVAYGAAGLFGDAGDVLDIGREGKEAPAVYPMLNYLRGYYSEQNGALAAASQFYAQAKLGPVKYTNPHRLEEMQALEAALRHDPRDAHAHLLLGNLLYAKDRREEGFAHWMSAVEIDGSLEEAWRNVAYGRRYLNNDLRGSYQAYLKTLALDPKDARALLELDQVAEQLRVPDSERITYLESHLDTVNARDDFVSRLVDLRLEQGGRANLELAQNTLSRRHFHTWEGNYEIHHAWVEVNRRLGDLAFAAKQYDSALDYYRRAGEYPRNLEVAPRSPDFRAYLNWDLAKVYLAKGDRATATRYLEEILGEKYGKPHLGTYYQALAEKALGNRQAYAERLAVVEKRAREMTSGAYEYRGRPQAIGHYLLSLVLEEKADKVGAADEHKAALSCDPYAAREAITEAQIDTARAHQ